MTDSPEINGITAQDDIIIKVRKQEEMHKSKLIQIIESDEKLATILDPASRRNAITWLTAMPRKRFVGVRYNINPEQNLRCKCEESTDLKHILSCRIGGTTFVRHNAVISFSTMSQCLSAPSQWRRC
ncbi:hypothetical protein GJ496_003702 [Pomphorhynchus laevis]|nr:hypothetical protein GJ496_003702 [Pomphorhynchus laevis]